MPPARRSAKTPQRQKRRATKTAATPKTTAPPETAARSRGAAPAKTNGVTRKTNGVARKKTTAASASSNVVLISASSNAAAASAPIETVAVVGAGRLGSALARALDAAAGYRIVALVSRRRTLAALAARPLRPGVLALSANELDKLPAADLVIIATPDDQIAPTAARLAAALGVASNATDTHSRAVRAAPARAAARQSRARAARGDSTQLRAEAEGARGVVLHASGALSSEALSPLRALGFRVGSLHPLVSVSDPAAAASNWRGAFFCVEGDAAAERAARRVVRALAGHAFSVRARDKALYHAAAVLASGHAVALFDLAARTLAACGLSPREARRALLPLTRSTVANLAAARANAPALTGPFARADVETVRRHLAAFEGRGLEGVPAVYSLLGAVSLALAEESGADSSGLAEIARLLSDAEDAG